MARETNTMMMATLFEFLTFASPDEKIRVMEIVIKLEISLL